MRGKFQDENKAQRLKSWLQKPSLPTKTNFKLDLIQAQRLKSQLQKPSLSTQTNFKSAKAGFVCVAPRFQRAGYNIAGFTLLELIIVISIIGILSAIALPNWIAFVERQRLNTAQNQVYLALRSAQSEAKRTKVTWQTSFREHNGIVQWAIHPAIDNHTTANWNSLDSEIQLDQETTFTLLSTGIRQVEFGFMGEVKSPPLGRITLSSKKSGKIKRCVVVSTLIGTLRTAKENPTPKEGKYCY
jgi:prepilin-type N-terminal cleavage/methylation domain-containing protein